MAKIYRLCSEYHHVHLSAGWTGLLRHFTQRPTWKRVAKYDNLLRRIAPLRTGNQPAGISKKATLSRRSRSSSSDRFSTGSETNHGTNDCLKALVQLLLSGDFLNEVDFVLQGRKIAESDREEGDKLYQKIQSLRQQSSGLRAELKQDLDGDNSLETESFLHRLQRSDELKAEANRLEKQREEPLERHIQHETRVLALAYEELVKQVTPLIEQTNLFGGSLTTEAVKARLAAPLPSNNIWGKYSDDGYSDDEEHPSNDEEHQEPKSGTEQLSEEQQAREALRDARRRAFLKYDDARNQLELHREGYDEQLGNHRKGISPGWPDWDRSWNKHEFDGHHLRQAMNYSGEIR